MENTSLLQLMLCFLTTLISPMVAMQDENNLTPLDMLVKTDFDFKQGNEDQTLASMVKELLDKGAEPTNCSLWTAIIDDKEVTARVILKKMNSEQINNFLSCELVRTSALSNKICDFINTNRYQ